MPSALSRRLDARAAQAKRAAPFRSYAQRGEDVVLWRALSDVYEGFYVDVGAESPDHGTVTRAFYERDWSGINVEPTPYWHNQLVNARSRDTNVCAACAEAHRMMALYEFPGTGLTTHRQDYAERHRKELKIEYRRIEVPCVRLDSLLTTGGPVHFLKIDVEGAERQVLEGIDLRRIRPWVIVIEATEPNSETPSWEEWEELVTGRGYDFAYFDGLNRYYTAAERAHLRERIAG